MTKEYKDLTPKEKYDSAVKQDADKSQPGTIEMLKNLGKSLMGKDKPAPAPEKKMAKGGSVSSASKRADGCCVRGKTKA
jgi:hypothetical protein